MNLKASNNENIYKANYLFNYFYYIFTPMEVLETRGRPRLYNFNLKKGQIVSMPENKSAQIVALKTARQNGWKFRTWNLKGTLFVKRIK